jgi:hypothetical protein
MTETGYLVWLISMALMTMAVLTVGTLGAAELLPHQRGAEAVRRHRNSGPQGVSS